ncbi:MAG TPA: thiamine pyrophosphate-dependent dehydrogenase E1 component subunit alpha [Acidimicrobiales bacterium]
MSGPESTDTAASEVTAAPTSPTSPAPPTSPDPVELLRKMLLIRVFEETTIDVYRKGQMPGLAHSYAGQEASAVGVCSALRDDDTITSTHRGHGHILAKGADPVRMMLEVMGKRDGYCRGKGGSMHIADAGKGVLGANGVVAGGVGIALGAALSADRLGQDRVSVCFIGDGAMNQGVTFEVMNMAVLWQLPLIIVCENNLYGQYSPLRDTLVGELADRPRAMGMPTVQVDGMDVLAVAEAMGDLVAEVRAGGGPRFLEVRTYRYGGHHVAEVKSDYRTEDEIAEWRARDPIHLLEQRLVEAGTLTPEQVAELHDEAAAVVARAREAGLAGEVPDVAELTEDVYA